MTSNETADPDDGWEVFTDTDGQRSIRHKADRAEKAEAERDEARETIRRLNRRAQLAEAALHKQLAHPNGAQDPTVNALGERVRDLEVTIQRVRDLHQPHPTDCSCHARRWDGSCFYAGTCNPCHRVYPCPTIRALDQEAKS